MRLLLVAGFLGSLECSIEDSNVVPIDTAFTFWPIWRERMTSPIEILALCTLAAESALPELNAHSP
jgi:hypothetical protein